MSIAYPLLTTDLNRKESFISKGRPLVKSECISESCLVFFMLNDFLAYFFCSLLCHMCSLNMYSPFISFCFVCFMLHHWPRAKLLPTLHCGTLYTFNGLKWKLYRRILGFQQKRRSSFATSLTVRSSLLMLAPMHPRMTDCLFELFSKFFSSGNCSLEQL